MIEKEKFSRCNNLNQNHTIMSSQVIQLLKNDQKHTIKSCNLIILFCSLFFVSCNTSIEKTPSLQETLRSEAFLKDYRQILNAFKELEDTVNYAQISDIKTLMQLDSYNKVNNSLNLFAQKYKYLSDDIIEDNPRKYAHIINQSEYYANNEIEIEEVKEILSRNAIFILRSDHYLSHIEKSNSDFYTSIDSSFWESDCSWKATACVIVASATAVAAGPFAPIVVLAGSALCYCEYCSGDWHDEVCGEPNEKKQL